MFNHKPMISSDAWRHCIVHLKLLLGENRKHDLSYLITLRDIAMANNRPHYIRQAARELAMKISFAAGRDTAWERAEHIDSRNDREILQGHTETIERLEAEVKQLREYIYGMVR